jgi:hypothetical protein
MPEPSEIARSALARLYYAFGTARQDEVASEVAAMGETDLLLLVPTCRRDVKHYEDEAASKLDGLRSLLSHLEARRFSLAVVKNALVDKLTADAAGSDVAVDAQPVMRRAIDLLGTK